MPYRNLGELHKVIEFLHAAVEEVSKQVCLDGVYAPLDGLVVLQGFKEFEVEGDDLALNDFCVTSLGKQENKVSLMGPGPLETTGKNVAIGNIQLTFCQFVKILKTRSPPFTTSKLLEF